jgi:hypothetical protein
MWHEDFRKVRLGAVAFLLVMPMALWAIQTLTPEARLHINGQPTARINRSSCNSTDPVEVKMPQEVIAKGETDWIAIKKKIKAGETTRECDKNPNIQPGPDMQDFSAANPTFEQKHLLNSNACGPKGEQGEMLLCIYDKDTRKENLAKVLYSYDTREAHVEGLSNVVAANKTISFTVLSSMGGNSRVEVCYGKVSAGDIGTDPTADCPTGFTSVMKTPPEVSLEGLENKTEYDFKVRIVDGSQKSPWSTKQRVTVVLMLDALGVYEGQGGTITYEGCQQSDGQGSWLWLLVGCALLILRRGMHLVKSVPALVAVVFLVSLAPTQEAQAGMNFGILGSPYRPDLDSEISASGKKIFPFYKCSFRKSAKDKLGPVNPLMGFEVDWHIWRGFGTLQLGVGTGYTFTNGYGLGENADGTPDCAKQVKESKLSLHMYQIRPQITFALDGSKEAFPLFPYARAGLIGHGYSFRTNGKASKTSTSSSGHTNKANGITFGWEVELGLMLMLDFLEPSAISGARASGTLDHVYLKGGLAYSKINSFGTSGFQFSPLDIMGTGWPLLWNFGLVFEI